MKVENMTSNPGLKAAARARMAATGESYSAAFLAVGAERRARAAGRARLSAEVEARRKLAETMASIADQPHFRSLSARMAETNAAVLKRIDAATLRAARQNRQAVDAYLASSTYRTLQANRESLMRLTEQHRFAMAKFDAQVNAASALLPKFLNPQLGSGSAS